MVKISLSAIDADVLRAALEILMERTHYELPEGLDAAVRQHIRALTPQPDRDELRVVVEQLCVETSALRADVDQALCDAQAALNDREI